MAGYYVVGRDWPDQLYATNAKWPVANQWHSTRPGRVSARGPFRANVEETMRAGELEDREIALRQARKLKKQLFAAIIQRDVSQVRQMLKRTPLLLERRTPYGASPLGLAAAVGDPALVALLLEEGCDVAAADRVGATPLIAAAARGHTQVCEQLLASKQGGNRGRAYLQAQATRRAGERALHAAAKGGHLDTVQALLAAGADPAATDREGRDCLMLAAANDHPNVMTHLMAAHAASPAAADAAGRTALMHAAAAGAVQSLQLLLSLPPSPSRPPTPRAAAAGDPDQASPAAAAAAAVPAPPDPASAATATPARPDQASPSAAAGGPDQDLLHQTDLAGYGPLHHACLGGSVKCVEALTARGLALSPADPGSLALLRLAARAGHGGVVDWLLQAGVGLQAIMADGSGNPVFWAVRGGSAAAVDVLLRHGARVDPRDSKGRTPLGVAAEAGDTALCRHLVGAAASLLAADNRGRVPRRLAYVAVQRDTAEALAGMARLQLLVGDDELGPQASEAGWRAREGEEGAAGAGRDSGAGRWRL